MQWPILNTSWKIQHKLIIANNFLNEIWFHMFAMHIGTVNNIIWFSMPSLKSNQCQNVTKSKIGTKFSSSNVPLKVRFNGWNCSSSNECQNESPRVLRSERAKVKNHLGCRNLVAHFQNEGWVKLWYPSLEFFWKASRSLKFVVGYGRTWWFWSWYQVDGGNKAPKCIMWDQTNGFARGKSFSWRCFNRWDCVCRWRARWEKDDAKFSFSVILSRARL